MWLRPCAVALSVVGVLISSVALGKPFKGTYLVGGYPIHVSHDRAIEHAETVHGHQAKDGVTVLNRIKKMKPGTTVTVMDPASELLGQRVIVGGYSLIPDEAGEADKKLFPVITVTKKDDPKFKTAFNATLLKPANPASPSQ